MNSTGALSLIRRLFFLQSSSSNGLGPHSFRWNKASGHFIIFALKLDTENIIQVGFHECLVLFQLVDFLSEMLEFIFTLEIMRLNANFIDAGRKEGEPLLLLCSFASISGARSVLHESLIKWRQFQHIHGIHTFLDILCEDCSSVTC